MEDIYEEIVRIKQEGDVAALATIVWVKGSTPRSQGSKMLIKSDGSILGSIGGGCMEAEVWQEAMKVMEEGNSKALHFDLTGREETEEGLICGGTMEVLIEPILAQPTLYLFGAGHIAFAVSRIGKMVGFRVVVIEERPAFANAERFPDADEIYAEEFESAFPKLKINKASYIVIACRGHLLDQQVLEWAVKTPARYIGMIGSKKKVKSVFSNLRAKGIPQELLDPVHAPIGLDIASETPEEIAVSIVGEVIKVRREKPKLGSKGPPRAI
jgi:xanthine dehydrogenase accessory factor